MTTIQAIALALLAMVLTSFAMALVLAASIGRATKKINFLRKEIGDIDQWNASAVCRIHENLDVVFAEIKSRDGKIERINGKFKDIALLPQVNSMMSKLETRMLERMEELKPRKAVRKVAKIDVPDLMRKAKAAGKVIRSGERKA